MATSPRYVKTLFSVSCTQTSYSSSASCDPRALLSPPQIKTARFSVVLHGNIKQIGYKFTQIIPSGIVLHVKVIFIIIGLSKFN